jgi:hypothetical protein
MEELWQSQNHWPESSKRINSCRLVVFSLLLQKSVRESLSLWNLGFIEPEKRARIPHFATQNIPVAARGLWDTGAKIAFRQDTSAARAYATEGYGLRTYLPPLVLLSVWVGRQNHIFFQPALKPRPLFLSFWQACEWKITDFPKLAPLTLFKDTHGILNKPPQPWHSIYRIREVSGNHWFVARLLTQPHCTDCQTPNVFYRYCTNVLRI